MSTAEAESLKDVASAELPVEAAIEAELEELGPGKRKHRPNTLYKSNMSCQWRHHDNEDLNKEPDV
jgi:hypothetical protein